MYTVWNSQGYFSQFGRPALPQPQLAGYDVDGRMADSGNGTIDHGDGFDWRTSSTSTDAIVIIIFRIEKDASLRFSDFLGVNKCTRLLS